MMGGMAWMLVFGAVWLGLIVAGVVAVLRYVYRPVPHGGSATPLEILERRFAEGDIDIETFDEARARIRDDR